MPDSLLNVIVTVTRSAGADRAVVVLIDTNFEPDASDGGPGLRVLVNDGTAYAGVAREPGGLSMFTDAVLEVDVDDLTEL